MTSIEGQYAVDPRARFAIVAARFNDFVVGHLIDGALDCLHRHGVTDGAIEIYRVPGSFEIPVIAAKLAREKKFDAIICLGAVIRGDTPHFDYVASEVSKGVSRASQETGVPIIYGVLTTDSVDQAIERAGTKAGNRGFTAALDAIEMASLVSTIDNPKGKK